MGRDICPVCGFSYLEEQPRDENGRPSFDICDCCGIEFGYEDCTEENIIKYRNEWIESGGEWFIKEGLPIGQAMDLIENYMSRGTFKEMLEWFKDKTFANEEFYGVLYSEEYDKDEEGYFGEDKILIYVGNYDLDNTDQIVSYDELYNYLKVACEYYIENIPEDKEEVEALLAGIKDTYNIK